MFESLYKIDSKGKIREWKVFVEGNIVVVDHGVQGGKRQEKRTACSSKNIGKSNETTPEDQAVLEAQSKWKKQLDKGYAEIIPDPKDKLFLPMLAHRYDLHKKKLVFPAYIQRKYDGIRSNVRIQDGQIEIFSRRNKCYSPVLEHLIEAIKPVMRKYPGLIIDGELYSHDLTLQDIASAVKRDVPNDLSPKIQIHYYDCYDTNKPNMIFEERFAFLKGLGSIAGFIAAETVEIKTEEEMFSLHSSYLLNGYEGSILRNKDGIYKVDGRSHDLLKVKCFEDSEFMIVGKKEDKNKECVFACVTKDGNPFDVKIKGDHTFRNSLLYKDLNGKMLSVRFAGWTPTEKSVPFQPVGICIRDYE